MRGLSSRIRKQRCEGRWLGLKSTPVQLGCSWRQDDWQLATSLAWDIRLPPATLLSTCASQVTLHPATTKTTRSPAVAREDALQPIRFLLQYWPSRSSKVNDFFYLTWKNVYSFPLLINSNLSDISHRLATIHPWQTAGRQTDDEDGQTDTSCHKRASQHGYSASKNNKDKRCVSLFQRIRS